MRRKYPGECIDPFATPIFCFHTENETQPTTGSTLTGATPDSHIRRETGVYTVHERCRGRHKGEDGQRVISRELDVSFNPIIMVFNREQEDAHLVMYREHVVSLAEMR